MKSGKLIISLAVLALLVGLGTWAYYHVNFSFANFRSQLQMASTRETWSTLRGRSTSGVTP